MGLDKPRDLGRDVLDVGDLNGEIGGVSAGSGQGSLQLGEPEDLAVSTYEYKL